MDAIKTTEHARALLSAHGGKAEAEAAHRMQQCAQAGRTAEAENWRKIRLAVSEMRGPRQG
ncbi:hypothetical protein [Roseovarius salinarum]|uniref:hypothetical protein n=1 Tax=Roseovarius salinarum TaxID=1981892 RepID=UPI000C33942A|nr:hypothetical protein [Roseovarius salinarum]